MAVRAFDEQVALVTGGAAGIGLAVAQRLADEGATVVVADVDEAAGAAAAETIESSGGKAMFVRVDVAQAEEVRALVDQVMRTFGRLDAAFNNAGILGSTMARTAECSEANWRQVLDVNLTGTWLCMKHELRKMRKQKRGAIVNAASAAAHGGSFVSLPYTVSKHGIIGLTKFAAVEYAPYGVRVNAVCPGYIRTPMLENLLSAAPDLESRLVAEEPLGRLGTPADVANAVRWLLSDEASFVTGHALIVDGGILAT
jgi:NAD(P)-dependent dehydrogenase (short-subunit alcohol dehydrogenase family)